MEEWNAAEKQQSLEENQIYRRYFYLDQNYVPKTAFVFRLGKFTSNTSCWARSLSTASWAPGLAPAFWAPGELLAAGRQKMPSATSSRRRRRRSPLLGPRSRAISPHSIGPSPVHHQPRSWPYGPNVVGWSLPRHLTKKARRRCDPRRQALSGQRLSCSEGAQRRRWRVRTRRWRRRRRQGSGTSCRSRWLSSSPTYPLWSAASSRFSLSTLIESFRGVAQLQPRPHFSGFR